MAPREPVLRLKVSQSSVSMELLITPTASVRSVSVKTYLHASSQVDHLRWTIASGARDQSGYV
jgi:hypothetical protein